MLAGMSLGTELKRYSKGAMPRLAIVTIILLPLLYGAMYLWVYWNPFNEVNKLPVALVNQDTGAQANGQDLNAGDQVVDSMVKSGQLDLIPTSAADAADGLAHGRYYFTITLPQDFSSSIASATTKDPHKAQVQFAFNDANSYLAGVIGNTAATQVTSALNEQIGGRSVDQILVGLQTAGSGLERAADGAGQLQDGTEQLMAGTGRANDGAQQLADGANELATNMATAKDGAQQLADGNAQLADGIAQATGPLKPLLSQVQGLGVTSADAAQLGQLSGQLSTLLSAVGQAGVQQSQAAQAVEQTIASLRATGDPNARALANGLKPVLAFLTSGGIDPDTRAQAEKYSEQAGTLSRQLNDPDSSLRSMLDAVNSGELAGKVDQLSDGAQQLKDGSAKLADGLNQLNDGSQRLAAGADQLAGGLPELDDGAHRLNDGASQLHTGLADGVKQIPDFGGSDQRQKASANLSSPVALKTFKHNAAPNFGTGFAPFFLPLALFIGTMIIWMLLKPIQPRPLVGGLSGLRTVLASYWPASLIAAAQVIVMFTVSHFFVGLDPAHPLGMLGFMLLVGAAFLALIQMLNVLLGVAVGRVASLAVLMVMIVCSGGVYPVETTARPAQLLHPYDPMSYAVTGLRQLIAGGIDGRLWHAVIVLACIMAGALAVSAWGARRNRQYTMVQLFPPIQV
ncbi:MAG: YhgE/Pip domain-containing protein [Gordonia sp. (in: high G+C Gram-positive bacteria)]|uniref:YhgE/Pip family protein n=1 Tax=Gordonia sp. (in: high G+C Gram-positive bacteria) TaxID=84139 RepID=UPI0039E57293